MAVTRERLYEEVWSEPMTTVAARYDVSSSFLARVCARLSVPRPPRGYWARLAAGMKPKCPTLPEAKPGGELEWVRDGEPRRVPRALPKPPDAKSAKRPRMRTEHVTQHPLLQGVQEHFEAGRESDEGYLKPAKKLLPDLVVSKNTLPRALEIANDLFCLLENQGCQVTLGPRDQSLTRSDIEERERGGGERHYSRLWSPARPTVVFIGTLAIGLTLFEMTEEVEVRWKDGKYVRVTELPVPKHKRYAQYDWTHKQAMTSGRICLQAYSPYYKANWQKQWRETKQGDLPGKLASIVREFKREAPAIAKLVEMAEQQIQLERQRWEEMQQQWRLEEAERRHAQAIKTSREDLFSIIAAWAQAKQIEDFFKDAELRAADLSDNHQAAILDRLKQARELLGGVDALQRFVSWKSPEER